MPLPSLILSIIVTTVLVQSVGPGNDFMHMHVTSPRYYRRYGHSVYATVFTTTTPQVHFGNDALYYMEYT